MRPCRNSFQKQIWMLDEFNQLRLRNRPDFCLRRLNREIRLDKCSDNAGGVTRQRQFFHDKYEGVIFVKRRKMGKIILNFLGLDTANKYGPVRMFVEGGGNESLTKWIFV